MPYQDPAAIRRRLQRDLKQFRVTTGMTQKAVADAMDWSPSKVIRIEAGAVSISRNDLVALLQLYGRPEDEVQRYIELNVEARRESWADYRAVLTKETTTFFGYEASAAIVRQFESSLVPGLLQTEEYSRALLDKLWYPPESGERIDGLVAARKARQQLFEREETPELFFVLDESALRHEVGGANVMRHQLDHIAEMGQRDRVSIQIVPFSAGSYNGLLGPFILLEFDEDDTVLYLEGRSETVTRDDPESIGRFLDLFQMMERQLATKAEDIGTVIARIQREANLT